MGPLSGLRCSINDSRTIFVAHAGNEVAPPFDRGVRVWAMSDVAFEKSSPPDSAEKPVLCSQRLGLHARAAVTPAARIRRRFRIRRPLN